MHRRLTCSEQSYMLDKIFNSDCSDRFYSVWDASGKTFADKHANCYMPVILLFLVLRSILFAGCRPPPSKSNTGVNHLLAGKTPSSQPDRHIVVKTFPIYFWGICKKATHWT